MNSRERVLTALQHREPDRVPYSLRLVRRLVERLRETRGGGGEVDYPELFAHDVRYAGIDLPKCPDDVPKLEWCPRPTEADVAACAERTRQLHARGLAVSARYTCGLFEQLKHWYGDVETLTMPYENPERLERELERELERVTAWKLGIYSAYVRSGVDIAYIGDDLGAQQGLIMSPDHYRRWYRPRHRRIVEELRRLNPEIRIAFHCCGHVTPLVPDLIEIGIDILEAVQAETMDIAQLKADFGRDISFWGAVGAQSVLARTTPEQVIAGVRRTLEIMGPGGGYIASPCHTLTEEVSWESIVAFHEAVRRYGEYPLGGAAPAASLPATVPQASRTAI